MTASSMARLGVIWAAALTASCALAGPPVPVSGGTRDVSLLEGRWSGEYFGDADHLRHGTISFTLASSSRQARGRVLMHAEGLPKPDGALGDTDPRQRPDSLPDTSVLTIRFVFVSDGVIAGELDPYWDPDRAARAVTAFRGSVDGGTISGTFQTRYANGSPTTAGQWRVRRGS